MAVSQHPLGLFPKEYFPSLRLPHYTDMITHPVIESALQHIDTQYAQPALKEEDGLEDAINATDETPALPYPADATKVSRPSLSLRRFAHFI
jgi:hypothetical protein